MGCRFQAQGIPGSKDQPVFHPLKVDQMNLGLPGLSKALELFIDTL